MTTGKICPNCQYQRKPGDDDFTPEYECPKCGIIYAKSTIPKEVEEAAADNNTDNTVAADMPENGTVDKTILSGKIKLAYAAGILFILIFSIYFFSGQSSSPISGTYTGEIVTDKNVRVSVEFDVNGQQRITRIFKRRTSELHSRGSFNIEETFLWKYPDISEVTYKKEAMDDPENHTGYTLQKNGKSISVKMDDPFNNFHVDTTIKISDPEEAPIKNEIKKFRIGKNLFSIRFSHYIFKSRKVHIKREHTEIPEQIDYSKLQLYCSPARRDLNEIVINARHQASRYRSLPVALPYSYKLSDDFNQCLFCLGDHVRPAVGFKIMQGDVHDNLQRLYDGKIKHEDIYFDVDMTDSMLTLEIPKCRLYTAISINENGYGVFGSGDPAGNIPVSKIGMEVSEGVLNNSEEEWHTVFIKTDPRYKNGAFESARKRQEEALRESREKMKTSGAEE